MTSNMGPILILESSMLGPLDNIRLQQLLLDFSWLSRSMKQIRMGLSWLNIALVECLLVLFSTAHVGIYNMDILEPIAAESANFLGYMAVWGKDLDCSDIKLKIFSTVPKLWNYDENWKKLFCILTKGKGLNYSLS